MPRRLGSGAGRGRGEEPRTGAGQRASLGRTAAADERDACSMRGTPLRLATYFFGAYVCEYYRRDTITTEIIVEIRG